MKIAKFFFTAAMLLLMSFTKQYAQNPIATLNHLNTLKTFSGRYALKDAQAAATDGDVITLSAGMFEAVGISKRITLRGAGNGIVTNGDTIMPPHTSVVGNFNIVADAVNDTILKIEGIRFSNQVTFAGVWSAEFLKCYFANVDYRTDLGLTEQHKFIHCFIDDYDGGNKTSLDAWECYFKDAYFNGDSSKYNLYNCVISLLSNRDPSFTLNKVSMNNCIIVNNSKGEASYMGSNSYAANCLWYGKTAQNGTNPFHVYGENVHGYNPYNNHIFPTDKKLFKNEELGILSDEGKKYLGSDKTELGIYGGSLPFNTTLSNPQIKKFEVAKKTTTDGKLEINIELSQD